METVRPNVVSLLHSRSQDTVETLRDMLAQAEAGELQGFIYVACYGPTHNVPGATGEYRRHPLAGLGAASKLIEAMRQLEHQAST